MTAYFFDSSGIAKRYIVETGSAWIRNLLTGSHRSSLFVSELAEVELNSSISRRLRAGDYDQASANALRRLVGRHFMTQYLVIEIRKPVVQVAIRLVSAHPLRSLDALQLASALEAQRQFRKVSADDFWFITSDRRLEAAAQAEGLATDDPTRYP